MTNLWFANESARPLVFAPLSPYGGAVFRGCALRFAPFARHFSPSGLRRPAFGAGMHFYVSHRPALRLRGVPALRTPFGRVLAPSALRAFTFSQAFALQKMPEMTYTPQFAMVVLLRLAACSTPLLIGLTSRFFAHRARASCAPATAILNSQWSFRVVRKAH